MTLIVLWAGIHPGAGEALGSAWHTPAHLVAFALVALAWGYALPTVPRWAIWAGLATFGFLHEAMEIATHHHPFELEDAVVDAIGALAVFMSPRKMSRP